MAVNYPARKSTGNRAKDVQDPLWALAESKVWDWLVDTGHQVTDARAMKTYHDFTIDYAWTVDVKCDQYAAVTGRLAWELFVDYRGKTREGWGRNDNLSYVAFVLPQTWQMYFVDAEVVREALAKTERMGTTHLTGCVPFNKQGSDGRTAVGIALSLDWLRSIGAIKREAVLD